MPTASLDRIILLEEPGFWFQLHGWERITVHGDDVDLELPTCLPPPAALVLEHKHQLATLGRLRPTSGFAGSLAWNRFLEDATSDRVSVASAAARAAARWFGRRGEPFKGAAPTCEVCGRWNYHLVTCPRRFR